MNEPYRLTEWFAKPQQIPAGRLFTCARPGRSLGRRQAHIGDEYVLRWVAGLPASEEETIIVSLLGKKPDGLSEFSYYSFRGGFEYHRPNCPTFGEWLNANCRPRKFEVYEFPTIDLLVPGEDLKHRAVSTILSFLEVGKTVVIVDSGGIGRTGNLLSTLSERLGVELLPQQIQPRAR